MDKLFLDTDVIIDFLVDREPFASFSSRIFDLAEKGVVKVYISSLSVNNIYYITRKLTGEKKAIGIIRELTSIVDILEVGKKEISVALSSGFKDFEGALQHATAIQLKGIKALLTRNIKDYRKSQIAIFTPESYLKLVK